MSCEICKVKETDATKEAVKSSRLMSDMVQAYDRQNKRLWVAVLTLASCLVITASCMIWAVSNAQRLANEAMLNALNSVAEIGVTQETTTVTQDTGEGGGNAVYQAGEYATYEEGGAG